MSAFGDAFRKGQKQADAVKLARSEIASILERMKLDVLDASEGTVEIQLMNMSVDPGWKLLSLDLASLIPLPHLAATNPKVPTASAVKLARWVQSDDGYPCTIKFAGGEHACYDGDSLRVVLAELLASGAAGELLQRLASAKPPASETEQR